jgi:hypothetical protein
MLYSKEILLPFVWKSTRKNPTQFKKKNPLLLFLLSQHLDIYGNDKLQCLHLRSVEVTIITEITTMLMVRVEARVVHLTVEVDTQSLVVEEEDFEITREAQRMTLQLQVQPSPSQ